MGASDRDRDRNRNRNWDWLKVPHYIKIYREVFALPEFLGGLKTHLTTLFNLGVGLLTEEFAL